MLGVVAAGPRSAEDGDRGADSTGGLGVGTMGWGTGEAGALEAAAGGAGAGGEAGAAAMAGPDGLAGAGTTAMAGPDGAAGGGGEAGDGGRAGGAVVTPLDAVPGDPPAGLRWLSASFESGGGDRRGSSGFDGGLGTSAGGDATRSC